MAENNFTVLTSCCYCWCFSAAGGVDGETREIMENNKFYFHENCKFNKSKLLSQKKLTTTTTLKGCRWWQIIMMVEKSQQPKKREKKKILCKEQKFHLNQSRKQILHYLSHQATTTMGSVARGARDYTSRKKEDEWIRIGKEFSGFFRRFSQESRNSRE